MLFVPAFFQPGDPIYSAKSVRFRMGHPKSPTDIEDDLSYLPLQQPADDKFIWTYTSEEFAMTQVLNCIFFVFSLMVLLHPMFVFPYSFLSFFIFNLDVGNLLGLMLIYF